MSETDMVVVLAGHAYAGAVIGSASDEKVAAFAQHASPLPAATQRFMAERVKACVRTAPADHMPMITAAPVVVDMLLEAVRGVKSGR